MTEAKPNIIVRLPEELRALVLSFCDSSTVLNACLTSKATQNTCLPSLFHTVDLSTYNELNWRRHSDYINVNVPAAHPRRRSTSRDDAIMRRQRQFINLLKDNPSIGSQIRVLRWTVLDSAPADRFNQTLGTFGIVHVQEYIRPWEAFQLCTKIMEVDIACMSDARDVNVPSSLISSITSLSLCGTVSHSVIASLFNTIDSAKLRHLRLNNVQLFVDPLQMRDAPSNDTIMRYRPDRPGAMQGYLTPLVGRCPSLQSLHILTTAEFVDLSMNLHGLLSSTWHRDVADEHFRYGELGAFVDSVKGHLREFIFEHGPDIEYFGNAPGRHSIRAFAGPTHNDSLPMDVYFDTHILPVIASGGWHKLQKIVVRGIGHWKPLDPWREESTPDEIAYLHRKTREFRDRADLIWDAVGGNAIETTIEDEASQPFYRLQADKRRSLIGDVA